MENEVQDPANPTVSIGKAGAYHASMAAFERLWDAYPNTKHPTACAQIRGATLCPSYELSATKPSRASVPQMAPKAISAAVAHVATTPMDAVRCVPEAVIRSLVT